MSRPLAGPLKSPFLRRRSYVSRLLKRAGLWDNKIRQHTASFIARGLFLFLQPYL